MRFDTIQLPALVIADLYKQSLVVLEDVQLKAKKPTDKIVEAPLKELSIAVAEPENEMVSIASLPLEPVAVPAVAEPIIHYMGNFKQQVSVVIHEPEHEYIADADLEFLKKMMAACKLSMEDMAIINVANNQPAVRQLWQLMPAKAVLMFGVTTDSIGIPFYQPDFKVQHWSNAKFMNAPALLHFRGSDTLELKTLKRELWEGLQKIFFGK